MRYDYALEKFATAVETLATGAGDVRERLRAAYWPLHLLNEKDLPEDLLSKWAWIMAELVKFGPQIDKFTGEVFRDSVRESLINAP